MRRRTSRRTRQRRHFQFRKRFFPPQRGQIQTSLLTGHLTSA
jgi:hypothetical protein